MGTIEKRLSALESVQRSSEQQPQSAVVIYDNVSGIELT
jgi:hypothetical protein